MDKDFSDLRTCQLLRPRQLSYLTAYKLFKSMDKKTYWIRSMSIIFVGSVSVNWPIIVVSYDRTDYCSVEESDKAFINLLILPFKETTISINFNCILGSFNSNYHLPCLCDGIFSTYLLKHFLLATLYQHRTLI